MNRFRCTTLIVLAVSQCLLFTAQGFAQVRSHEITEAIEQLTSPSEEVRARSVAYLGFIGAELSEVESALIAAADRRKDVSKIRINEDDVNSHIVSAYDLVGSKPDQNIDDGIRKALNYIREKLTEIESALLPRLDDTSPKVRSCAAFALGLTRAKSNEALTALMAKLQDGSFYVRSRAAFGLTHTKAAPKVDNFKAHWLATFIEEWLRDAHYMSVLAVIYLLLLFCWLLIFWARPLWLLSISGFLYRYEPKIKTQNMDINLPLRHLLLVSLLHFRERVLDRWVLKYLETARENFESRPTVKQRNAYVQSPAELDGAMCESVSLSQLQPVFDKPKTAMLIFGEGGAGKTSLTCQLASWAMADKPEDRLCKGHRMLPVLIEGNIEAGEKNALIETISGHLKELIGEPEPVSEELLSRLLRKRRVLVIVDSLSELDSATRNLINPVRSDFPAAALIVTSRLDDELRSATRTTIKPLRLQSDRLSKFINDYLVNRKKRDSFTDEEYFDSCRRLSQIVGNREITALIAKLYAEQMIAGREQTADFNLPRNLPDLMLGYVKIINERVQTNGKETRDVQRAAKILAWACLKQTCRPAVAKRIEALKAMKEESDGQTMLGYLEDRLQLIQTVGSGDDDLRFSLDPLAEYLACLHLVEECGRHKRKWEEVFDRINSQPGKPETIRGFLLALRDCCEHKGPDHGVPETVLEKLSFILSPAPEAVSGKQPEFV